MQTCTATAAATVQRAVVPLGPLPTSTTPPLPPPAVPIQPTASAAVTGATVHTTNSLLSSCSSVATREHDAPSPGSRFLDGHSAAVAEACDDAPEEEYVVRVKAQVMKRDESTQMWLPTRGDPWSVVGLLRRRMRQRLGSANSTGAPAASASTATAAAAVPSSTSDHPSAADSFGAAGSCTSIPPPVPPSRVSPGPVEYIIYARRVKDGQELINCRVEAEFYYCSANPLFHHWMAAAGERRHGLAFVNARDASRFERHVRRAVADVKTGGVTSIMSTTSDSSVEEVFAAVHLPSSSASIPRRASPRQLTVPHPAATVVAHGTVVTTPIVRPTALRSNGSGGTGGGSSSSSVSALLGQVPPAPLHTVTKPLSPLLQHRPPALPPRANSAISAGSTEREHHAKPALLAPHLTTRGDRDDESDVWVHRGDHDGAGGDQEGRNGGGGGIVVVRQPLPQLAPATSVVAATETTSLQDVKRRRQYSDYRKDYYVSSDKPLIIRGYSDVNSGPTAALLGSPAGPISAAPGVGGNGVGDVPKIKSASPTSGRGGSATQAVPPLPLESASALSIGSAGADPKLPTKQKKRRRLALRKLSGGQPLLPAQQPAAAAAAARGGSLQRCRNCHAVYHESDNPRGGCPEGRDPPMLFIERVTCAPCVDGVMYHCVNDEDDVAEESLDAWSCSCPSGRRRRGTLKWVLITALGLVLPCVWCYPPLAACHRAARRGGVSGPRHASGGSVGGGSSGGSGGAR